MKRWKKIALVLLALVVLSQTPFVYRRYRLGQLRARIDRLNASRSEPPPDDPFADRKGVIHVHSFLGGHSEGRPEEIVAAARANGLDFVVMTEHPARHVDTSAATLSGVRDGVLFVPGSELSAAGDERAFIIPGFDAQDSSAVPLGEFFARAEAEGRLALVAYPEKVRDWSALGPYDGIEVYNLYTNTKRINYALLFFDGLWSYWSHPDLLFATFYEMPRSELRRWDELTKGGRRLTAVAGNDAHANVGVSFGDRTGDELLAVKLDPYERSFRVVRNHVLLEKSETLDAATLLSALRRGRSFIAFDLFGDASGFRFTAEAGGARYVMGDEVALAGRGEVRLAVRSPVEARIRLLRDGETVREERDAAALEMTARERGVYRVEVYLDGLGAPLTESPWVVSNPIYVR
ncbi:MAG TPA: CehA/McbA family metallohydrolase [Pyrinomonadaceae bacterium]|nr:CehA/McbA family metallohydrolase [Pyrinomonadaceae bacterium]